MQALKESGDGSREKAQALRQAQREQILALLTEEQRTALEELKSDLKPEDTGLSSLYCFRISRQMKNQ